MSKVKRIAEYFLLYQDDDDCITNMKLQKLLYYAQGFHIAFFDKPLFAEKLEAWTHGPVVPSIYRLYKQHGRNPLPMPTSGVIVSETEKWLLDEVYSVFGKYSANELRNMTHTESPYVNAVKKAARTITFEDMSEFFKTLVVDD